MTRFTLLRLTMLMALLAAFTGGWDVGPSDSIGAVTWHVSTTGSDVTGDGSAAKPFAASRHSIAMTTYESPTITVTLYLPIVSAAMMSAHYTVTLGSPLQFSRTMHTATRLIDGKILIVGGTQASNQFVGAVELYDPATGQSSLAAALHTPRHGHSATLLTDGRVLIVGGYSLPQQWLTSAELYDPAANTWTMLTPPHKHGVGHTATLLADGRVLLVGGCIGSSLCTDQVDIYDPQTNLWSTAQALPSDRASHSAQLLQDGRVLIVGGGRSIDNVPLGGEALVYNPQTNTWTSTGPMVTMRLAAQAVQLADGRVLITGGLDTENPSNPTITANAEIYDPLTNAWSPAASLAQRRYLHDLVALSNGHVLAIGGVHDPEHVWTTNSFVREIELYDPETDMWRTIADLTQPRASAASVRLSDGRVWITGGRYLNMYRADTWLIEEVAP